MQILVTIDFGWWDRVVFGSTGTNVGVEAMYGIWLAFLVGVFSLC